MSSAHLRFLGSSQWHDYNFVKDLFGFTFVFSLFASDLLSQAQMQLDEMIISQREVELLCQSLLFL